MNKALLLLPAFACGGCAIVFVPPAIYVVSLSLGAFVTNAFLFVAAWMAVSGLLDRRFFGKRPHELIRSILSAAGKAFLFLSCAALPVLALSPVTPEETIYTGAVAGSLFIAVSFLASFRDMRLSDALKRNKAIAYIALSALFTAGATYASVVLAQETDIIHTKETYEKEDNAVSAPGSMLNADMKVAEKPVVAAGYWFLPRDSSECMIFLDGKELKSFRPENNCYHTSGGRAERIYCPVYVGQKDLPAGAGLLEGIGSCTERYETL
jgi:hypothetical protein